MKKNIGQLDKVIRVLFAIIIAVMYLTKFIDGTIGIYLLVIACLLIFTSIISFCPIYFPFGFSSKSKKNLATHQTKIHTRVHHQKKYKH